MRALATTTPVSAHGAAVDEGRRVAGDEDEDLGGVGEAVIADRDPADDVRGDVIEKDQPQREATEKIEPQVAIAARSDRRRFHRDDGQARPPHPHRSQPQRPPAAAAVRRMIRESGGLFQRDHGHDRRGCNGNVPCPAATILVEAGCADDPTIV